MSKEGAKRLLSLLEDFISFKPPGHFAWTVRDGKTVFILQLGFNAHGYFLMLLEFLRGRRKGFIVVPEGNLGCGWRGFGSHLRKALAPGTPAFNLSPKLLPGSKLIASKSFAAVVVLGRRSVTKTHRQAGWRVAYLSVSVVTKKSTFCWILEIQIQQILGFSPWILAREVLGRWMLKVTLGRRMFS